MSAKRQYIFLAVAFFVLIITLKATLAQANEKGEGGGNEEGGDKGKEIGKGDEKDNGKGKGDAKDEKSPKPKEDDKGKGNGDENGKVDDKGKPKGDDKGKGKGDKNGKVDDKGKPKGDDKGKGKGEDEGKAKASTNYIMLGPVKKTGQEQALCMARGRCSLKTLTCPNQCKVRKPKKARKLKGCFIDCSKCETTCKYRKPNCNGFGSVCYDPRFVGGDGVMFYFHGATGGNFALVSDGHLQINAHFIGNRPQGRNRDFTWIQALSVMFDSHTLVIAAQRIAKWDDAADALILRWDGEDVAVPTEGDAEWRITTDDGEGREVIVERTEETNNIRVAIDGLVEMDLKVTPIGEEENRVHNYQIPAGDAFAHLETQFRFANLSEGVEGVLGQTYQPRYVSPVKTGVAMPMMGGEDKYRTASLFSPVCAACRFRRWAVAADVSVDSAHGVAEL